MEEFSHTFQITGEYTSKSLMFMLLATNIIANIAIIINSGKISNEETSKSKIGYIIFLIVQIVFVLNIVLFAIFIAFTLKLSLRTIKYIISKKNVNMRIYFVKYIYTFLFIIILISFTSLYETFIAPYLLKIVVKLF